MRWLSTLNENIKRGIRSWLNVQPASPTAIQIQEFTDFELTAIRNRIWYRGDGNELEQMYRQSPEAADKHKFWASRCTPGMEMRKIHTGLPGLMIRVISSIVLSGMGDFEFTSRKQEELWKEIEKDNEFRKGLKEALRELLYIGDGAYKVSIDTRLSAYPILEWVPGERIEIIRNRKRLKEVVIKTEIFDHRQRYILYEHYGYGYIKNELYRGETLVDHKAVDATRDLMDLTFDESIILAVPMHIYGSAKWEGRGGSLFDAKADNFDALDEAWSQWMDALRAGRAKTYIPECLVPHDPETGRVIRSNPFDNRYFASDNDMSEKAENKIQTDQPTIPYDSYQASYCTALDLCLQGIISPSTLGIDVKKLDNAEAQREKEKTTLYTRDAIVDALQDELPRVVSMCLNAYHLLMKEAIEEVHVDIPFAEYANPSFESQVETLSKARPGAPVMSVEAQVEELYGDTKDEEWKKEEIGRLKAEQGIAELDEPGVNMSAGGFQVQMAGGNGGDGNEGQSNEPVVSDGAKGVPGAVGNGQ